MSDDPLGRRGDERPTLIGFLDWYRTVVEHKVDGLRRADAVRVMTPSGLCPLGIVKHLAVVELDWFCWTFAGEDVELPEFSDDNAPTFLVDDDDSVESVLANYQDATDRARRVVDAAPSLDGLSAREDQFLGKVSLRWVLIHMVEETARHAGHLDIMREQIDGRTGD